MIKAKNGKLLMTGNILDVSAEAISIIAKLTDDINSGHFVTNKKRAIRVFFTVMQKMLRTNNGIDIEIRIDGEVLE